MWDTYNDVNIFICSELEKSTAADCYYVEALTGCKPLSEQAGVTAVTEEEMKAADITCEGEYIKTKTVKEWKGKVPDLSKIPCIFLLYK